MKKHNKDRSEQQPLLYISQPHLKTPTAPMQQSFIIKSHTKRQKDKTEQPISLERKIAQLGKKSISTEETEAVIPNAAAEAVLEAGDSEEIALETSSAEEREVALETVSVGGEEAALEPDSIEKEDDAANAAVFQEHEETSASSIRKSFRDMNIEEKLSYLLNRPHYIPKVMCEVETKTGTYVGYIVSFDNGVVILRTHAEFFMTKISYQDIIDIQMRAL